MKKIRIAFLANRVTVGGLETVLRNLGNYLVRQGYEVDLLTTVEKGEWFDSFGEYGVKPIHIAGHGTLHPFIHAFRVARRLAYGRYDVIFLNNCSYAQAIVPMLPDNVAVIPILHGTLEYVHQLAARNRHAWNVAVAVGPQVKEIAAKFITKRPIVQIPNGIEIPQFDAANACQVPAGQLRLAYVGRLERLKGVALLPQIVRRCLDNGCDIHLDIAGDGEMAESLRASIREFDVANAMTMCGFLSAEKVRELLFASHVLLMPTYTEGMPLSPLEAQVCGCVPVVTRLPGVTDFVIQDHVTGLLCEKDDVGGFAAAIQRFSADSSLWQQMSDAGRAFVEEHFSVDAMGKGYDQLIQKVLVGEYPLPFPRMCQSPIDDAIVPLGSWAPLMRRWSGFTLPEEHEKKL